MDFRLTFLPLLLALLTSSCTDQKTKKKNTSVKSSTVAPSDLENEMASAQTDFLRSFADHKIAWQKWDKNLLEKAQQKKLPIFALVGSAVGDSSRAVGEALNRNNKLRKMVTALPICTVIDTHLYPEIGQMGYQLCSETKRSTAFPMMIWFSSAGDPLAWIPVGDTTGRQLDLIVSNAVVMVEDIWTKSPEYAITNSKRDNEARQKRLELDLDRTEPTVGRTEAFRRETRQLSSLYNYGDKDLDYVGGLVPHSSIELLATGTRSGTLTDEVRQSCRSAASELASQLVSGALRDQLDGSYFYARRTGDWSLPSFTKSIASQAKIASMLLRTGDLLDRKDLSKEGLHLLQHLETEWLAKKISVKAPKGDPDLPGLFLWDFKTLSEVLTAQELEIATIAFALKAEGNIPLEVDPLGNFHKLNSLRNNLVGEELAKKLQLTTEKAEQDLQAIKRKLKEHRQKNIAYLIETTMTCSDLALMLKAQIFRAVHTGKADHLKIAIQTAEQLIADYWQEGKGLTRIQSKSGDVPARAGDYGAVALALTHLYQFTLDPKWLEKIATLVGLAQTRFGSETTLLSENMPDDSVISLRQYSISMIFGESTAGLSDRVFNRLFALTGKKEYRDLLDHQYQAISFRSQKAVVNHTDFIISCALGDADLLAVFQGDPDSAAGKTLLQKLNSQHYLSFLTIRPESGPAPLKPLSDLPTLKGDASVVILKAGKPLGQTSGVDELVELLDSIITSR